MAPVPGGPPAGSRAASVQFGAEQLAALDVLGSQLDQLDYFAVLKLEQNATPADIKKAFYRESRAYHPDRFYHLTNKLLKITVNDVYKRVTEAYYVLRDDSKRNRYLSDINGPERANKLRFSDATEAETKQAAKREQDEQIGVHPKGRQFFQTGFADFEAERWSAAERNFKMALTYEPQNARYKEKLSEAQQKIQSEQKKSGDPFKIK